MADETFGIAVEIKGGQQADRQIGSLAQGMRQAEGAAKALGAAASGAAEAVGQSSKAQAQAARQAAAEARAAAKEQARAQREAAKEIDESARAAIIAAERRARERVRIEREAARATVEAAKDAEAKRAAAARSSAMAAKAAADAQKRSHDALAGTYRAIIGPAAEYNRKLQEAIALERQGAISAKQRAQYVAGLQREIKQHNAAQRGGFVGGLQSAAMSSVAGVAGPAAAVGAAVVAAKQVYALSESYNNLSNSIRQATNSEEEMRRVRAELFDAANRSKVGVETLTNVYTQARIATKDLGTSQRDLIRVSELLSKATRGVAEVNKDAGLRQFGQALSKGKLQAEELMSIMENIPKVGVLLAEGMGTTVGGLRKMAEEGKVSTADMLAAIMKMGPEIDAAFGKSRGGAGEAFTVLKNQILEGVGGLAEQVDLTGMLVKLAEELGAAFEVVGTIVGGVVGFLKDADKATGGMLGKLAKMPGLFGSIKKLSDMQLTHNMYGQAQMYINLELVDIYKRQTAEIEKQMAASEEAADSLWRAQTTRYNMASFFAGLGMGEQWDKMVAGVDTYRKKQDADRARRVLNLPSDAEMRSAAKQAAAEAQRAREEFDRMLGELIDRATSTRAALDWGNMGDVATMVQEMEAAIAAERDEIRDETEAIAAAQAAAETERLTDQLERQRQIYEEIHGPANEYRATLAALDAEFGRDAMSLGEYIRRTEELRASFFGGQTIMAQMAAEAAEASEASRMLADTLAGVAGQALNDFLGQIVDLAITGRESFREMAASILRDLTVLMAKLLAFQALKAAIGVSPGSFGGAIVGALGLGANAAGGTYKVPALGPSGTDSVPFYGVAQPGETITVSPLGRSRDAGAGGGGPISIAAHLYHDPTSAMLGALRSPAGQRAIVAAVAANPGAARTGGR